MVNQLRDLMHQNVATPPADDLDLSAVLRGGRRRVRRHRVAVLGATAAVTAAGVGLGSLVWPSAPDLDAAGVPAPDAPTLHLADAQVAVRGEDYRVLASHTNEDLNQDNGQYFDGVTEDGLILFRDGPRMDQLEPRYALLDPATGRKDWLPEPPQVARNQAAPVHLGRDRLVLTAMRGGRGQLFAAVFDRKAREWDLVGWPGLPAIDEPWAVTAAPDGRLYVRVPATEGQPPEGGWPTGPDGEAEDAGAPGDTYRLWSVSLTDSTDVRDEQLTVGQVAFTESSMVWTDSTNGDSGRLHVRDLASGTERSFDPRAGDRCNLLSFGATAERIVLGQYCGTYDGGVRDDRVQILDTEGRQVVTVQDSMIDGALPLGSDLVVVTSYQRGRAGTFVYDLAADRFLRLSEDVSSWQTSGPAQERQVLWSTPVNHGNGAAQWFTELVD